MEEVYLDMQKKTMGPATVKLLSVEEKIQCAENLIDKENLARSEIVQELEERKFDRDQIIKQLEYLRQKRRDNRLYYARNSVQYIQQALDEHNGVDHYEHIIKIKCLFHRLKHGRNSLAEEKRILREINCTKEQCKKLLCEDVRPKKWVPWHLQEVIISKKSIKDHMEVLLPEMPGLRKEQRVFDLKVEQLKKGLVTVEKNISSLQRKLNNINREKEKLYAHILELKK